MLAKSNIFALVGGGKNSRYPPNKVIVWDDHYLRPVGELSFTTEIKSVKLSFSRVYVVLETTIYIFTLRNLYLQEMISTWPNPRGVCSLSFTVDHEVFAFPGAYRGHALVKNFKDSTDRLIEAHETGLACLCLNKDGTLLATCSDKGTLVRIFLIDKKELIQELRRGIDRAEIYSLAFHNSSKWIACSSDTGTVHVYSIISEVQNRKLGLKFFKKIIPKYFESEWSIVHFKVKDCRTRCAFVGDELKIVVITDDGMFFEVNFADKGNFFYEKQVRLLDMVME